MALREIFTWDHSLDFYLCGLKVHESQFTEMSLLGQNGLSISCPGFFVTESIVDFNLVFLFLRKKKKKKNRQTERLMGPKGKPPK